MIFENTHSGSVSRVIRPFDSEQRVCIEIYGDIDNSDRDFILFHPHQDEITSTQVGKNFVDKNGGAVVSVIDESSRDTRNINFTYQGAKYNVDPNRIFTKTGLRDVCKVKDDGAIGVIEFYVKKITDILDQYDCVIALHNNLDSESFSIRNYFEGGEDHRDVSKIYFDQKNGTANFFITNSLDLFSRISSSGFNVVLYSLETALNDGCLAYYVSGLPGKKYVNIEAKKYDSEEQSRMLYTLIGYLRDG